MCGRGKNNKSARNDFVTGINLLPDSVIPFSAQMDKYWKKANSRNKIRIHRIVQSFSREELNPENPADILLGHEIGVRTAKELYGEDCQIIVATQTDGKGHCVHNHILVSNVTLNGTGLASERTFHPHVRRVTDEITAQFIDIPDVKPAVEKESPEVRGMRISNREAEGTSDVRYIWQDDLRNRIRISASEAQDMDDFFARLQMHGVKATVRKATKKQPEHILYELTDTSGFADPEKVPGNLKSKSYKMGLDFQPEGILSTIKRRKEEALMLTEYRSPDGTVIPLKPLDDIYSLPDKFDIDELEKAWEAEVRRVYYENCGWPILTKEEEYWKHGIDYDTRLKRSREADTFVMRFKIHQNEQKNNGIEIPGLYSTSPAGLVHTDYDELDRQINEFIHLNKKDDDENETESASGDTQNADAVANGQSAGSSSAPLQEKPVDLSTTQGSKKIDIAMRTKVLQQLQAEVDERASKHKDDSQDEIQFGK